jgi:predicted amidohydrolase
MRKRTEIARFGIGVAFGCLLAVGTSLAAHDDDACGVPRHNGRPHYVEPTYSGIVKVAAVQTSPRMFDNAYNLSVMLSKTDEAAQNGASLVAFPELSLTAYKYSNTAEAMLYAEPVPGPSTDAMAAKAVERGVFVVFGLLEKAGEDVFDTVAFVGPEGYIGKYRKVHQGYQSESLVFSRGTEPPPVFATSIGRIGLANCYDGAFPETARLLALQGADIMVYIYNESGAVWRDYVLSRGAENNAFVVAPNRIGSERLSSFNGGSFIGAPGFQILATAGAAAEQTVYADLDLGSLGTSSYMKRRPELYEAVAEPYPPQILSADITPEANVTGSAQDVAVTIVTASIPPRTPVVAELRTEAGVAVASIAGHLGCNRKRLTLSIPAAAEAGNYAIHVTATPHEGEPQSVVLPYTIKPTQKPVAMGRLPVGAGATVSGSVYVSFDINVKAATKIPITLVGPTSTKALSGSVNNDWVRATPAWSTMAPTPSSSRPVASRASTTGPTTTRSASSSSCNPARSSSRPPLCR